MKFENGIAKKYRDSIEAAFSAIAQNGNAAHREMVDEMNNSEMLIRCNPVSKVNASGRTGLISTVITNAKMLRERLGFRHALAQVYIDIAEETIDTGGQRGCEGTFVHEGQHAMDFAKTIESISNADLNPIGLFDPTLYELEWNAHVTAGDYMICIGKDEYLEEGLELMILERDSAGKIGVSPDGIRRRLRESYGLSIDGYQGPSATQMMGIVF